jgi:LPXTG-motif cell wall-anchored protein
MSYPDLPDPRHGRRLLPAAAAVLATATLSASFFAPLPASAIDGTAPASSTSEADASADGATAVAPAPSVEPASAAEASALDAPSEPAPAEPAPAEPAPAEPEPSEPAPTEPEPEPTEPEPTEPVDTTPPVFTAYTPVDGGEYAEGEPLLANFSWDDADSGMAEASVADLSTGETIGLGETLNLPAGEYTWVATGTNGAGLSAQTTLTFRVVSDDITPPTVTSDWTQPVNGWTDRTHVYFNAEDAGTGVKELRITRNGMTRVVPGDFAAFEYLEGEQEIAYSAVDQAGNASTPQTLFVRADWTSPDVAIDPIGTAAADGARELEVGDDARFTYSASDAVSGIALESASYMPGTRIDTSKAGEQTLFAEATDYAGNATRTTMTVRVLAPSGPTDPPGDTTKPTVTIDWTEPPSGWTPRRTLNVTAADADSGIDTVFVERDGRVQEIRDTHFVSSLEEGEQELEYWARDKAGNESEHRVLVVRADWTGPQIAIEPVGTAGERGVRVLKVGDRATFDWAVTDALSGVSGITASHAAGTVIDTSKPAEFTFSIEADDRARNLASRSMTVRVVAPSGPTDPTGPGTPTDPTGPGTPTDPTGPGTPTNPTGPGTPTGPGVPTGPAGPAQPSAPAVPAGNAGSAAAAGSSSGRAAAEALADTGAESSVLWSAAAGLLAIGAAFLVATRRIRRPRG